MAPRPTVEPIGTLRSMDLIPKPGQIVSAASNVAHQMLYGGLADLRPMPRTLIDDGPLRELYHYRPQRHVRDTGDPVLLVTPLAAPALCYDLRRSCSLVEHLVQAGRPTYLVEYGEISFRDRTLGMEHWVEEVVPEAIRGASEHAGGRPVHVIGWSLGGIFSVLAAANDTDLPIASLTVVGSPFDVSQVPLIAPLRPILDLGNGGMVTHVYRLVGGAPKPLVRRAFQLASVQKLVTKPYVRLRNLDDAEFLAQLEAVDRFAANMIAYPGRTFGQLYHRMVRNNALKDGVIDINGHDIRTDAITLPVLVLAGNTDGIAPINSVRALVPLLPNASEVCFEIVPGGHLGMLTGRAARGTTWRIMDEWISEHSTADSEPASPRQSPAKRMPAAARPTQAMTGGDPPSIGASPDRTYRSASSRGLARK